MADKTNLIRLKPGSEVSFNGNDLGYTNGISITLEREFHKHKNQKYGAVVVVKTVTVGATIEVNLLEYNSNTDELIMDLDASAGSSTVVPTSGALIITGKTMAGNEKEFKFYRAFRESTGGFDLDRNIGSGFSITFRAIYDSVTEKIFDYTGG